MDRSNRCHCPELSSGVKAALIAWAGLMAIDEHGVDILAPTTITFRQAGQHAVSSVAGLGFGSSERTAALGSKLNQGVE